VVDLLKIAKHGRGTNVYLVRFHFIAEKARASGRRAAPVKSRKKKLSSARQRARVVRIIECLPEAAAVARNTHLSLEVRKKRFGYFLDDHHADGRIAVCCKASADLRDVLQQTAPSLFHIPKYVGSKGWIGLWLDGEVDWSVVEVALREAYRLVAPKARKRTE
jgi:predicted DNA-binding protein (MmcQ/YjbR family)